MIDLVIFDCDGVLIDSEGFSRAVIAEEAAARGVTLGAEGATRFTGLRWADVRAFFAARLPAGTLPSNWGEEMQARNVARMRAGLRPMPGAADTLRALDRAGVRWCVGSNSSPSEMDAKFALTGLSSLVRGRIYSARAVPRGKPAPDLYFMISREEGVAAERCLVVEDSRPGVEAALAAGMKVVRYRADYPEVSRIDELRDVVPAVSGGGSAVRCRAETA